jgi:hypothetical protein
MPLITNIINEEMNNVEGALNTLLTGGYLEKAEVVSDLYVAIKSARHTMTGKALIIHNGVNDVVYALDIELNKLKALLENALRNADTMENLHTVMKMLTVESFERVIAELKKLT